jgi:cystathionine gamma-synthase
MSERTSLHPETLAVHAGHRQDRNAGAIVPPISLATTFERSEEATYPFGYTYSRNSNPNRASLEECLAMLEGGTACAAFASGMAAISAVFHSLSPGDHIIAPTDAYYNTGVLLRDTYSRWGLEVDFVDLTMPEDVKLALRPTTKLVWIETPTNPLLKVVDIERVAAIAHDAGALCACDNTFATPVLQHPLALGVDLVIHSTTKYLGGHSDLTGGGVIANEESPFFERIREIQVRGGAVPSPFDCWLLMRGIATLPLRVRAQSASAQRIAEYLAEHPGAEAVHYPGLASHPGHEIAARQMSGFGGVLSVEIEGGAEAALRVASRVRLFTRATSLGGVHSLIEHRASIEPPGSGTPAGLLRLSIGIEHVDDLIADLERALGESAES